MVLEVLHHGRDELNIWIKSQSFIYVVADIQPGFRSRTSNKQSKKLNIRSEPRHMRIIDIPEKLLSNKSQKQKRQRMKSRLGEGLQLVQKSPKGTQTTAMLVSHPWRLFLHRRPKATSARLQIPRTTVAAAYLGQTPIDRIRKRSTESKASSTSQPHKPPFPQTATVLIFRSGIIESVKRRKLSIGRHQSGSYSHILSRDQRKRLGQKTSSSHSRHRAPLKPLGNNFGSFTRLGSNLDKEKSKEVAKSISNTPATASVKEAKELHQIKGQAKDATTSKPTEEEGTSSPTGTENQHRRSPSNPAYKAITPSSPPGCSFSSRSDSCSRHCCSFISSQNPSSRAIPLPAQSLFPPTEIILQYVIKQTRKHPISESKSVRHYPSKVYISKEEANEICRQRFLKLLKEDTPFQTVDQRFASNNLFKGMIIYEDDEAQQYYVHEEETLVGDYREKGIIPR
ncbi:hypothetical protein SMACR_01997 [Sordaria macrospora]|uniref:WGS project CABT00000000 data, contig 2.5 n=2 Tax=Sordaria macrospora TaxID=5147 RepID=F7VSG7_SORMK|nr:uncharacterized protein SMAC_01997 [Sordaria macrospora k-hell]KAA8631060.1 hypothetical protein SMACR_01997 [Sordaria macrospora]WPJ63235.1 hypothetical protein SMAC4_01997 [Sordaria macrospora]CCC08453.1 unnamed protein product [Sordaria macrospora k-hell]